MTQADCVFITPPTNTSVTRRKILGTAAGAAAALAASASPMALPAAAGATELPPPDGFERVLDHQGRVWFKADGMPDPIFAATFLVGGVVILQFGIRHGKSGGHGHLCGQDGNLRLSEHRVVKLANCTMSKEEYIEHLKDIGEIPYEDDPEDDPQPPVRSRKRRHDKNK